MPTPVVIATVDCIVLDRCTQHRGASLRMHACNLYGHVGSIQETYATTMCRDVISYGG